MSKRIDKEFLIEIVRNEPQLWDQRNKYYHNRNIKYELWEEIGKTLNVNGTCARKTWQGLRDTFRRKLKTNSALKRGQMAHVEEKWVFYHSMAFLQDTMTPGETSGNLIPIKAQHEDLNFTGNHENSFNGEEVTNNEEETDISSDYSLNEPYHPPRQNKRNDFNEAIEIENKKLALMEKLIEQNQAETEDEDLNFFKSLVPTMQQFSPIEKLKLKTKIMTEVTNALEKQINYSPSTSA